MYGDFQLVSIPFAYQLAYWYVLLLIYNWYPYIIGHILPKICTCFRFDILSMLHFILFEEYVICIFVGGVFSNFILQVIIFFYIIRVSSTKRGRLLGIGYTTLLGFDDDHLIM